MPAPLQGAFDNLTRLIIICLAIVATLSSFLALGQVLGLRYWVTYANDSTGLFFSPVAQGEFLALVVVALVTQRLWYYLPALIPGLVLCPSRAMWAASGLGIVATYIRKPLLLLILVLALAVVVTLHPSSSDTERLQIWAAAWRYLTLWGNGLGSFEDLWFVHGNVGMQPLYVHNDYLQLVFEFGIWALAPFALMAFALSRTQSPEWPILVAFLFMACFSMPLHIPLVAFIGALALARTLTFGEPNA
jgi:hypothetical protein